MVGLRRKKLIYLLILLIINQIMALLFTPLLIDYLFEEPSLIVELFAQVTTFILPVLGIFIFSSTKDESEKYQLMFKVNQLYKRPIKAKELVIGIVVGSLISLVVLYIINFIEVSHILVTNDYQIISNIPKFNLSIFLIAVFIFALLPAIFEELLFRGMYYDTLKTVRPKLRYLILILVFLLAHRGIMTTISALILSVLLVYLIEKGKSLILCVIIHFTYNLTALIFTNIVSQPLSPLRLLSNSFSDTRLVAVLFIYGGIILMIGVVVIKLLKIFTKTFNIVNLEQQQETIKLTMVEKMIIGMIVGISFLFFNFYMV